MTTRLTKKINMEETLHVMLKIKYPLAQHKYVRQTTVLYNLSEYDSKPLVSNKCDALWGHRKIKCHIISNVTLDYACSLPDVMLFEMWYRQDIRECIGMLNVRTLLLWSTQTLLSHWRLILHTYNLMQVYT